jgi:hypothetical protein
MRMSDMIEQRKALFSAVIVKDVSRFARDYVRAGLYIEEVFPENDIRFISVGEGVDSDEGENPYIGFMNITSEHYARDISKKVRLTNLVKGSAGIPLSRPPYGYMKDPENPKRWVIDDEAAVVVRRIFREFLDGMGPEQIAGGLDRDGILTPTNYWISIGLNRGGLRNTEQPSHWRWSTIIKILTLQEYVGDVINFKTYSKSFRLKKRIPNKKEDLAIFHDVHNPIVSREVWEQVQKKRGASRRRKSANGKQNMFSGLLVCADCGGNLNYHFNQTNNEIKYFNCAKNNSSRGRDICTSTHYIRVDFLEKVVLQEIRRLTKFACQYEDEFAEAVMGQTKKAVDNDRQKKQKTLNSLLIRDKELDALFNRMYEDNVSGKVDDARFYRMSKTYSEEQTRIAETVSTLQIELNKKNDAQVTNDMFVGIVRKYTRVRKLTQQMLHELIEKIIVYHAEKINGVQVQKLVIHYNCVGNIDIPELLKLPETNVNLNTRQGVNLTYSPKPVSA